MRGADGTFQFSLGFFFLSLLPAPTYTPPPLAHALTLRLFKGTLWQGGDSRMSCRGASPPAPPRGPPLILSLFSQARSQVRSPFFFLSLSLPSLPPHTRALRPPTRSLTLSSRISRLWQGE